MDNNTNCSKKCFIIEKYGQYGSHCRSKWYSLVEQLSREINSCIKMELKNKVEKLRYHPKNAIKIKDSLCCESRSGKLVLTRRNISTYWQWLESNKDHQKMFFYLGGLRNRKPCPLKSAVIISSRLGDKWNNDCHTVIKFKHENDWNENYKQLILFLNELYDLNHDGYKNFVYGKWPLKIFLIEQKSVDNIVDNAKIGDTDDFDIDRMEATNGDDLRNYFSNVVNQGMICNVCGIFVCYKKYFSMKYISKQNKKERNNEKIFQWVPTDYCNNPNISCHDIDWDEEYMKLTASLRKHYSLINVQITHIGNGDELEYVWEDLTDCMQDDEVVYYMDVTGQVCNLVYLVFFNMVFYLIVFCFSLIFTLEKVECNAINLDWLLQKQKK